MPIFEFNGKRYNVPDDKVEDFAKRKPTAVARYEFDGKNYNVPAIGLSGFLGRKPMAKQVESGINPTIKQVGLDVGDKTTELSSAFQQGSDGIVDKEQDKGFWDTALSYANNAVSYTGDLAEKIGAGAASMGGSVYSVLDRVDEMANPIPAVMRKMENEVARRSGAGEEKKSWLRKQADGSYAYADDLREKSDRYSGKDFTELWKEGDYAGVVGDVFLQASESIPQSLIAMFGGGAGLALTGVSAGARKYDQLDEMPETKDMPEYAKAINAITTGTIEACSEKLGDVQIGKWLKGLYSKYGKDAAEEMMKNNLEGLFKQQFKDHGLLLAPIAEGAEEYASQIAENVTDYCTGVTEDWNPMDGAAESFVYGAGGGAQFALAGLPGVVRNKYRKSVRFIDSNTHQDGNMYPATLKDEENTPVYIVRGNIVLNEDGTINMDKSDRHVTVNDNGKPVMKSIKDIAGIIAVDNAMRMKETTLEEIRRQEEMKVEEATREAVEQEEEASDRFRDITVEDYIKSTPGLTDYGKESAYNNEEEVVEKAKSGAKLAIAYRNGEMSPRDMLVNDVYGYSEEISDERAKEEADKISEYWTERYPQYIVKTKAEIEDSQKAKEGKEQDSPREINVGDEFEANVDGIEVTAQVQRVDPDGNAIVQFSQPVNVDGETGTVLSLTSDVLQKLIQPTRPVDEQVSAGHDGAPVENQPVNAQNEEVKVEYPRTKEGEIDYSLIEDSNIYASALKEEFGEDAPGVIDDLLAEKENELVKAEKKGNAIERKRAIKKVTDELNALKSVRDIVSPDQNILEAKEEPMEGLNEKEYYDWVSKDGDINEVTEAYSQLKEAKSPYNNLHEWQRQLLGKRVKADSYYQFGDRNNATKQMKAKWFSKEGQPLDVLAKELSELGKEVTERDIVEFITGNPSNSVSNTSSDADVLGQRFSELASKVAGMKIGRPDSPTGKLFMDLQKAKGASVSGEALRAMEEKLKDYEQMQPPVVLLEEAIPVKNDGVDVEDLEAYEREIENVNIDNNSLPGDDNSLPLQSTKLVNNEVSESISQGELGTLHEEDSRIEETLSELRRRGEKNARDAQEAGRTLSGREKEIEDRVAEQYAKEKGVWIPMQDVFNLGDPAPSGNENDVYLSSKENSVYKVNNLMNSGDISSLLERIKLHNRYFPQTKYKLVGFSGFGNRDVFPVLKQDYIENSTFATPEEINNYMQNIGFKQTGRAEYSNNDVVISDLYPRNVLKDTDGDVYVIDAEFKGKTVSKDTDDQESVVNTNPTEEQKEGGNYKKGHVKLNGFDITIEQPKGSTRSGVDESGKEWSVAMNNTYGYIRGTKGKDGDHIDMFIGSNPESKNVFVVDQVKPDGSFDEHKVMMGFDTVEDARKAYLANYEEGWQGLGNIKGIELLDFKKWIDSSTRKTKPFAEYRMINAYHQNEGGSITYKHSGELPRSNGEFCYVEREFRESGLFSFSGSNKIESVDDVAYIFRELENASIENTFVVLVNAGVPTVAHLGMGTFSSSPVNMASIKAAYDAIGAEKIYFVHNHPSGTLKCSRDDMNTLNTIHKMFPTDLVQEGIIINTTSGQYGTFDLNGSTRQSDRPNVGDSFPLSIHSFNSVVFSPEYNLSELSVISSSDDVAALVSSQRLGGVKKISYLILDAGNRVVGNIHTTYQQITDNVEALADELAGKVIRFGGTNAILYGDFDFSGISELIREVERVSGKSIHLLDVVSVDGQRAKSANDEGVMEETSSYNDVPAKNQNEKSIVDTAKENGTYLKAPNGKDSNLNKKQWAQVRTKAFKDWFGDWENDAANASKVVDENGEPMVVYHGSKSRGQFSIFSYGDYNGNFFTSSYELARDYASDVSGERPIYPVFLNIRNPKVIDANGEAWSNIVNKKYNPIDRAFTSLRNGKFDGIIERDIIDAYDPSKINSALISDAFITMNRNAIKSASDNNGYFDKHDTDIRFMKSNGDDIKQVNTRFNEELQQQVEGKLPEGHIYQLGKPSGVLLSAGIPNLPIELASSTLNTKAGVNYQNKHPFDLIDVAGLPNAINDPVAIFNSKTRPDSKVILTELEHEDVNFVVAMQIDYKKQGGKIVVNSVRSLYPKDQVGDILNWVNDGLLRWTDKKKTSDFLSKLPSQFAQKLHEKSDVLDSVTKIIQNFENPSVLEGEISSEIDRMSDELGVKVNKVKDRGVLPEGIQRKMKNGRYPGLYDVSTGEVYLVVNEITDIADAQATMLHEVLGHKGIHGLFGENLPKFCDKVLDSMNEQDRNKLLEDYDNNRQLAAEEYVASFAEGYSDPSAWEKVKAVVKDFFRKMGIDLKLSDNDLKYVLWKAKNGVKGGESVTEFAGKVVKDNEVKKVLFRTATRTREKMERLEKKIKELKESIRTGRKELKEIAGDMNKFVSETVSVEAGKEMNKSDIDALTKQVNAATTMRDLEIPMMEIERIVNDVLLRKGIRDLDNLTRLKVQGRNSKGVSVAKTVDNDTRIVFESIRDAFANLMAKDIDKKIRSLGKEASILEKELEEKPGDVDLHGRIDELRTRQNELKDEKIELLEKRAANNVKDIDARIEEIEGEVDENGELSEDARRELSVLNVKRAFSEVGELESELTSIDNEIIGLRKEGSEYWKKGDRVNHKLKKVEVKAKKRARLDVQRSLIEHVKSASGMLENIIEGGRSKLKDFNEARMNRKKEIAREAYDAVRGERLKGLNEPGSAKEREDKSTYGWKDFVKSPFMAPLITMEFMMKYIDKNHRKGKGPLYERFIKGPEGVVEAGNRFYEGLKSFNETVNAKMESVFGEKLSKVLKDQSREHEQSGIFVTLTSDSALGKAGAKRELTMSKGQALYAWLVWQMDDGRSKLEGEGYSGEMIEEIENFIGPKYVEFGKWLQDDYFPRLREEKYNLTHERLFGSSMAEREHYFPFFIFKGDVQEKGDLGETITGMPSVTTGNIINRVRNNSRIDTEKSAFDIMYGYGQKMEEWNAYAEVRQDVNGLLKNRYFRNMLDNNGKGLYKQFKLACEVGTRSFREDDSNVVMNKVMSGLNKVVASGAISFKLNTAVKQISSMPAVFEYSIRPEFLVIVGKNLGKSLVGENYRWCMKNLPSFQERVDEKNMGDEKLKEKSLKYLDMYHNVGMWSNRQVDALACAFVAKSVYEYGKKKYLKENSEVEADFLAKRDAEIAFNTSQQSSRPEFVSAMQASSHFGWRFLSTFMNSPFGFHRKMVNGFLMMVADYKPIQERIEVDLINKGKSKKEAGREAWKQTWIDRADGARQFALYGGVLYATFDLMSRGLLGWTRGDDDDDEISETLRNSFIFGMVMGTPVLGNFMKAISDGYEYNPIMLFEEVNDAVSGIRQAAGDNGWVSQPVIYSIIQKGLSVGTGVDLKTWGNVVLGVTDAAKDGYDVTDAMFLLNSPESQRKKVAEQMAKDLTIDEFAKKVSVAYKYLPKDGYWWVPDRKKLTDKRISEIDKKWNDWQLTPLERAEKKVMDETDKAVKVLYDNPELNGSEQEKKKQELYKEEEDKIKKLKEKYNVKAKIAK